MLARSPEKISILDVVNAVAPLERIHHCPLGLESHTSLCPLHEELDRAYAATEAAFASVSLGQILRSGGRIKPLCDVPAADARAGSPHRQRVGSRQCKGQP
jgi:DNA-binding IscR family transcriptional regulator